MQFDNSVATKLEIVHHAFHFTAFASGWTDIHGAQRACNYLSDMVEGLNVLETKSLYRDLELSGEAFCDDPIWQSASMTMLFEFQDAARREGFSFSNEVSNESPDCHCRLLPSLD